MLLLKPFTEDHGRSGVQPLLLSLRTMVWHHNTRTHVRLLGPCFKTGRSEPFRQHQGKCENTTTVGCTSQALRAVQDNHT